MNFEYLKQTRALPTADLDAVLTVPHPDETETLVLRARVWHATATVMVSDLGLGDPSSFPWRQGPLSLTQTVAQAFLLKDRNWTWLTHRYPEPVYSGQGDGDEQFRRVSFDETEQPFVLLSDVSSFLPAQPAITETHIPDGRWAWIGYEGLGLSRQRLHWVPPAYGVLFFDGNQGHLVHYVRQEPDAVEPSPPEVAGAREALAARYDNLLQRDHLDGILLEPTRAGWVNRSRANLTAPDQIVRPGDLVPMAMFAHWDPPLSTKPLERWTAFFQGDS
ncbi:hypothetical protein [Acanthopleuribacter pedis]|uniref:Uncharacterized protein n=1 Tax=Acanthopleuribacter pedis TaxID=442870 RepID=A0A8J7Q9F4_9BACT|nr:hypothetical protein [Acanthopleuribacter pedis]MBO1320340.1 hypothetical protein [Acanthopleuribacter pedis]